MTTIEAISQLNKIMKSKNWAEQDIDEFVFDNFCALLDNLTTDQRKLIIELVEQYHWISIGEYSSKILATMEKVEPEKLNQLTTIYLFPVLKPEDEGKFKSGPFLMEKRCFCLSYLAGAGPDADLEDLSTFWIPQSSIRPNFRIGPGLCKITPVVF